MKERVVLWHAANGRSRAETAGEMGVTEETIKRFRTNFMLKLMLPARPGGTNLVAAVAIALRSGWIE